jgi:hypothetical protein
MNGKQIDRHDGEHGPRRGGVKLLALCAGLVMGVLAVVAGIAGFGAVASGLAVGLLVVLLLVPWAQT